ncbi:MAG: PmeII family type II restriction endonuclease [Chloroflexi bacterium]|nr:PmeII family type II restriction endonuclease [Chloroflexota bacterium]
MTELSVVDENIEPISRKVKSYIDANIYILQQARLDKRQNTTLEDVFKGRNPYFLRSTRKAAWELVKGCLDSYLLSVDEILFADFEHELSAFAEHCGQQLLDSSALLQLVAQDDLPLRVELLEAYDRVYNRLTHRFFEEFCDEDGLVEWEQLAAFIYND